MARRNLSGRYFVSGTLTILLAGLPASLGGLPVLAGELRQDPVKQVPIEPESGTDHESYSASKTSTRIQPGFVTSPTPAIDNGRAYGSLLPPSSAVVRPVSVTPAGHRNFAGGGEGLVAYLNDASGVFFPPGAGVLVADDLETIAAGVCELRSYSLLVGGGGDGTGPGFSVQTSLYDGCPGQGGVVIPGTASEFFAPDDGNFDITVDLVGAGIGISSRVWIAASFSTSSAGWLVGSPAETGFTADRYHFPSIPCNAQLGGPLYAGFNARVVVAEDCDQIDLVQVNVDESGNNIPGDAANEPSIAVDPTNPLRMAIGWRQFDSVQNSFRQAGFAYTDDGGETWVFPGSLTPGTFRSDPVLDADASGVFLYSSLQGNFTCDMFRSDTGGTSWSSPVFAFGGDKQWIAVDRTDGPGAGHVYQAWSIFAGCCGRSTFNRSVDGGLSFEDAIEIPLAPRWGTLTVDPLGRLFVAGVTSSSNVVVRSSDAGNAATTPTFDLSSVVDLGGTTGISGDPNPGGLLGQVWIASDHSDGATRGHLYMLSSVDPAGSDPLDVMFARSTDGGESWDAPIRVNDDPVGSNAWQWFGTMSVAPNGRIDVVFNDTRGSPDGRFSQVYYTSSVDGGQTWTTNQSFTPTFDSHLGWPQQNKMGDYYDMVSLDDSASLAYAGTFNGEQDVFFQRLFPDCDENGTADAEDIGSGASADCNSNLIPDNCEVDCNSSGAPDGCDLASGTSQDCNENLIPDECDISSGMAEDSNGNGVPDECEVITASAPLAAGDDACMDDGDCENTAECIDTVCYVPRNRYLAVDANLENAELATARRVKLGGAVLGWVGEPDASDISRVVDIPYYTDWNASVPRVFIADCEIAPSRSYEVESLTQGLDPADSGNYSPALTLPTVSSWGDVVGSSSGGIWNPPNGVGNFDDVLSVVQGFQNLPGQPPLSWIDVADQVPNATLNFADVQLVVQGGFQGQGYPYPVPGDCP